MVESELATQLHTVVSQNLWGVYLCLLIVPFIQADAAVLGAASISLSGVANVAVIFFFIVLGLSFSDVGKYWLGQIARSHPWAMKYAQTPAVEKAQQLVHEKFKMAMITARFIPGTRMALYIGAGYFQAPWVKFTLWIVGTAIVYVGIIFGLFHAAGAVAGEAAKIWLPVIALGMFALLMGGRLVLNKFRPQPQ